MFIFLACTTLDAQYSKLAVAFSVFITAHIKRAFWVAVTRFTALV